MVPTVVAARIAPAGNRDCGLAGTFGVGLIVVVLADPWNLLY